MTKSASQFVRLRAPAALALAAALVGAPPAGAAEERPERFIEPTAIATVRDTQGVLHAQLDAVVLRDGAFLPVPLVPKPMYAFLREDLVNFRGQSLGSAAAQAVAANMRDRFDRHAFMVTARSDARGALASGGAYMELDVHDPQQRRRVKLTMEFQAAATIQPPATADWTVQVGFRAIGSTLSTFRLIGGKVVEVTPPRVASPPIIEASGRVATFLDGVSRHSVSVSRADGNSFRVSPGPRGEGLHQAYTAQHDFEVEPSFVYLVVVEASATGKAFATVDPVVRPHPDNPDVVVTFPRAAADPTPRSPLAGMTEAELEAAGFDVTPLRALGFFDAPPPPAPADATAPTTTAAVSPAANAHGWHKGPVTVDLAATDNPGGSGVKELHFDLDGASSGAPVVVPGDSVSVDISAEGATTLTYFAVDHAGNEEAPTTLTVRLDQTPPSIAGLPAAGCTLSPPNHKLVQVATVSASDQAARP
jgi:hypothetical protein